MPHRLTDDDPLWVPLLTHYMAGGGIDQARMSAHLESVAGSVRQIMLAGSTGDGWEMDDSRFDAVVDFAAARAGGEFRFMFGVLRDTTDAVVERMRVLEERLASLPTLAGATVGATICPPVDAAVDQTGILAHYRRILAESQLPIAVYQLPQVTGCRIAPETLEVLASDSRVVMFKDSSGEDTVATSGRDFGHIFMVRGAEGGYAEAVAPDGGYGGWLLSTANTVPAPLRRIETLLRQGDDDGAARLSEELGSRVASLFADAASEGGANAFSNANKAADHVRAYGMAWSEAPLPRKQDGTTLSADLVIAAEKHVGNFLFGDGADDATATARRGYLQG